MSLLWGKVKNAGENNIHIKSRRLYCQVTLLFATLVKDSLKIETREDPVEMKCASFCHEIVLENSGKFLWYAILCYM